MAFLTPRIAFVFVTLLTGLLLLPSASRADSLTITYLSSQTQTVVAGSTCCASVIFDGSVTNNTASPITFQLLAGDGSSFYVAGISTSIPFPGITIAGGGSQTFNLTVTVNPFDPSLTYPGTVNIVLDAISESAGQPTLTENGATALVVGSVPEPHTAELLAWALLASGVLALARKTLIGA
jgi:hypothetical protein